MDLLAWSVGLFVACGAFWLLIGLLTAPLHDRNVGPRIVIFSARTDAVAFGLTPDELLREPGVRLLRSILLNILAGLLTVAGGLVMAVAWFGLRAGERWALAALTFAWLAVLPFWALAARPFVRAGARVTLADLPPFMWVPAALGLVATATGWAALG